MRVEQEDGFKSITITLETVEEASLVWDALSHFSGCKSETQKKIRIKLCNWFSNEAKL